MKCLACRADLGRPRPINCRLCGANVASTLVGLLPAGTRLARKYEVLEVLGRGGFGVTYLAQDREGARHAIKEFLPSDFAFRQQSKILVKPGCENEYARALRAFHHEAEVLRGIDHGNVVSATDFFAQFGTDYLVMDWLSDATLRDALAASPAGKLSLARAERIFEQLSSGLSTVHKEGVLHLDIKPENIMLCRNDRPVLVDFGAARRLSAVVKRGQLTLDYSAPEVILNMVPDARADLFSLGAVVFECITGQRPSSALSRLSNDALTVVGIPPPWVRLLETSLAMDPADRSSSLDSWWSSVFGHQRRRS